MNATLRTCERCHETKSLDEFGTTPGKFCTDCLRIIMSARAKHGRSTEPGGDAYDRAIGFENRKRCQCCQAIKDVGEFTKNGSTTSGIQMYSKCCRACGGQRGVPKPEARPTSTKPAATPPTDRNGPVTIIQPAKALPAPKEAAMPSARHAGSHSHAAGRDRLIDGVHVDKYIIERAKRAGDELVEAGILTPQALMETPLSRLETLPHLAGRNLKTFRFVAKYGNRVLTPLLFPRAGKGTIPVAYTMSRDDVLAEMAKEGLYDFPSAEAAVVDSFARQWGDSRWRQGQTSFTSGWRDPNITQPEKPSTQLYNLPPVDPRENDAELEEIPKADFLAVERAEVEAALADVAEEPLPTDEPDLLKSDVMEDLQRTMLVEESLASPEEDDTDEYIAIAEMLADANREVKHYAGSVSHLASRVAALRLELEGAEKALQREEEALDSAKSDLVEAKRLLKELAAK